MIRFGVRPIGPPESATPRSRRLLVAWVLTIWTVLQLLTMVVAALHPSNEREAFLFLYTGMFTAALGFFTWRSWVWVARSGREVVRPVAGRLPLAADAEPPGPHIGLSGQEPPPIRW